MKKEVTISMSGGKRISLPVSSTNCLLLIGLGSIIRNIKKPFVPLVEYSALTAKWTVSGVLYSGTLLRNIDELGRLNYQGTADTTDKLLKIVYSTTGAYGAGWYVTWAPSTIIGFSNQGTSTLPPLNQADYQTVKSAFSFTLPITAHRLA